MEQNTRKFVLLCFFAVCLALPLFPLAQEAEASAESSSSAEVSATENSQENDASSQGENEAGQEEERNWQELRTSIRREVESEVKMKLSVEFQFERALPLLLRELTEKFPEVTPGWEDLDENKEVPLPHFPRKLKIRNEREGLNYLAEQARKPKIEEYTRLHPQSSEEGILKAAREKYPLLKIGTFIGGGRDAEGNLNPVITLRGGVGFNNTPRGYYHSISPERIRIGTRWISRLDLDEVTLSLFYKDSNDRMVAAYCEEERNRYESERDYWVSQEVAQEIPKIWLAHYYVPEKLTKEMLKNTSSSRWIYRRTFVRRYYEEVLRRKQEAEVRERLRQEFEEKRNWVFMEKLQDWMPADEAARWNEQQQKK